jgi:magnesium transporter
VRTRVWRNGQLECEHIEFDEVSDYLAQPDCLVWADLCNPDDAQLTKLAAELEIDEHAIEDARGEHERPKAMRYSTHLFLTTNAIGYDPQTDELISTRVSAFALARGFFTVRLSDSFDISRVVQRWDDNADLIKYGPRALIHGLLDEIVDGYFETVERLDDGIEELEDALFEENTDAARELQRRTFALRKSLVQARRTVLPMREVVNTVMRRVTENDHNAELAPYYEDLYDHVLRAAEWTESLRDMITSVFETNMSLADLRMNLIMKKLTSWAAIIAVPTAITGFYGQNVPYPGFGHEWGVWASVASILLIALALYGLFKRKDWL